jgi:predicted amidophosphoribosyltransferase
MQPAGAWICTSCGQQGNTGKFCSNCGSPKPADNGAWICTNCGQQGNTGKFCGNCGSPRP